MKLELSVSTAAEMAEVTTATIRTWIRDEGLPVIAAGRKGPGHGARIDGIEFVRWLVRRVATPAGSLDLEQERARLAKWQADKTQQDVEVRAGGLLEAEDVQRWVAGMIAVAKQRLLQIPDTVRHQVPHEHAVTIADSVRRSIYEALSELSTGPRKVNGNGRGATHG